MKDIYKVIIVIILCIVIIAIGLILNSYINGTEQVVENITVGL